MPREDLFKKMLKKEESRPTLIDWDNTLKRIADSYESHRGIPHGIQKDAVQNSWDARKNKKGGDWSLTFQLVEKNNKKFLAFTDRGTHGLTGRQLSREEMCKDLPPEERWGRFEGLAFTKHPSEKALGSRGEGKFIFVAGSKKHRILYDTLREDGVYRFGARSVEATSSPVWAIDGEKGAECLRCLTAGAFEPLAEVGTRVIIEEPSDEVADAVKSGKFLSYIEEVWWEIIKKYDAHIYVEFDGKKQKAGIPWELKLPEKDEQGYKVWLKKNFRLPLESGPYKIKRIHIIQKTRGSVPKHLRGIAVHRGGMKVCSIPPRYLPRGITESMYGYLWMDEALEEEMMRHEDPYHYGYSFRRGAPRKVMSFIQRAAQYFAEKKLGWGAARRKTLKEVQKTAETRARLELNRIVEKLWCISGRGGGIGYQPRRRKKKKSHAPSHTPKEIGVEMPDFEMPRSSLRINYGETLKNIKAKIVNNTAKNAAVRLKMYLFTAEGSVIKKFIEDTNVQLPSKGEMEIGPFELVIDQKTFPSEGKYSVRATLVSMMSENKGEKLDKRTKSFWVEVDPPAPGVFEKVHGMEFPDDTAEMIGSVSPGGKGGYIYYYNLKHPAYEEVCSEDEETITKYLLRAMAEDFAQIDLREDPPKLFSTEELQSPEDTARRVSKIVGKIMQDYYSSR